MSTRNKLSKSSTSSSANNHQQRMKVVYIKTHYVETDAVSFKAVVQNLTGKDSAARREKMNGSQWGRLGNHNFDFPTYGSGSLLTPDLSARDEFDVLPKELPAFEELQKLLSFD